MLQIKSLKSKLNSNSKTSTKLEDVSKSLREELAAAEEKQSEMESKFEALQEEIQSHKEIAENCKKEVSLGVRYLLC